MEACQRIDGSYLMHPCDVPELLAINRAKRTQRSDIETQGPSTKLGIRRTAVGMKKFFRELPGRLVEGELPRCGGLKSWAVALQPLLGLMLDSGRLIGGHLLAENLGQVLGEENCRIFYCVAAAAGN